MAVWGIISNMKSSKSGRRYLVEGISITKMAIDNLKEHGRDCFAALSVLNPLQATGLGAGPGMGKGAGVGLGTGAAPLSSCPPGGHTATTGPRAPAVPTRHRSPCVPLE